MVPDEIRSTPVRHSWVGPGLLAALSAVFMVVGCSSDDGASTMQPGGRAGAAQQAEQRASQRDAAPAIEKVDLETAQRAHERARMELENLQEKLESTQKEMGRLRSEEHVSTNDPRYLAASRGLSDTHDALHDARKRLERAATVMQDAREERERVEERAAAKKRKSIADQARAKEEAGLALVSQWKLEEAKAMFESIRDIPGIDDRLAGKAQTAATVEALIARRQDPQFAREDATKDEWIRAAAREAAEIAATAPEIARKRKMLLLEIDGDEFTSEHEEAFAEMRDFWRPDRAEARFVGSLRLQLATCSLEVARLSTENAVAGQLTSKWNLERKYVEALAESRADSPAAVEAAVLAARRQHARTLAARMNHESEPWRIAAARSLSELGPDAKDAVPALIQAALEGDSVQVRRASIGAICRIGPEAAAAVPALIDALEDEDCPIRGLVADALGYIGPEARDAIPALTKAMEDRSLQGSAKNALDKINADPKPADTRGRGRHELARPKIDSSSATPPFGGALQRVKVS